MTPERMARLVARWVRFYTRDLPAPVARRRAGEVDADVHDQIAHEQARGTGNRRIALGILSRMVRGIAADTSWRATTRGRATVRRSTLVIVLGTASVLLIPLAAMQFTDEVVWSPFDFVVIGTLLVGTGLTYRAVAARMASNPSYRAAVGVAIGAALLLVWMMGAVGIIGVEGDPADLMYIGVLGVGLVGAVVARLRPDGMARALLAMALAQALVAAIALIAGMHEDPVTSAFELLGLNAFFAALFAGSALLFRRAAHR